MRVPDVFGTGESTLVGTLVGLLMLVLGAASVCIGWQLGAKLWGLL
jgi:hypothetical protein